MLPSTQVILTEHVWVYYSPFPCMSACQQLYWQILRYVTHNKNAGELRRTSPGLSGASDWRQHHDLLALRRVLRASALPSRQTPSRGWLTRYRCCQCHSQRLGTLIAWSTSIHKALGLGLVHCTISFVVLVCLQATPAFCRSSGMDAWCALGLVWCACQTTSWRASCRTADRGVIIKEVVPGSGAAEMGLRWVHPSFP